MQLEMLETLCNEGRIQKQYQYKDISEELFLDKAKKSFNKLPQKQKDLVFSFWAKALGKNINQLSKEDISKLLKYRFICQTNLYTLCHVLEKYNQTTENTHSEICNSFFVQKDPNYITFEKFANDYTDLKERMLLTPRGAFKSSLNIADCVQWIICFPEITILILTGVYRLASDFVGELKQHFTLEETKEVDAKKKVIFGPRNLMNKKTGEWSTSFFQVLFPEHCVVPSDGSQFEFQTPAGGDDKEPTVRAASIEQALSGMHVGVLKLDDVVTNENCLTQERIDKVNAQISINKALLNPFGFIDYVGTWYTDSDAYGIRVVAEEKFAKENGIPETVTGSVDSGIFNTNFHVKTFLRACWWPTKQAIESGKIEEEMKRDDYILFFPERLTYDFLAKELALDKISGSGQFAVKYLNNPRKANQVKFPRELLIRRTIPHSQFPPQGIIVTAIDAAYSTKQWADYTVIITALIFGGRFYIINMIRGRFNEYELPKIIATVGYKWKPRRIAIEDSMGAKWLNREIKREMDNLKISIPIEFCSLGFGSKLRSKQMKAKPVLRLLGDSRMYLLNSCEGLEEIYNELEKFTGTKDDQHDDIVSAVSLLVEQFGGYADMDSKINSVNQDYVSNQQAKDLHDKIYCLGKYAKYNEFGLMTDNPTTQYQINTAVYNNLQSDAFIDPLADLMS